MQYSRENPYSREAIGPTLSAGWSAQRASRPSDPGAGRQLGRGAWDQRQPLLDQHVLVPLGGEPAGAGPDIGVQVCGCHAAAVAECRRDLVIALDGADQFLVDSAEEGRPGLT